MDIPSTAYPALGSVIAALVAGAVGFVSTVLSKEQKTSEFRQAWVDALRTDISDVIGFIEGFSGFLHYKEARHGTKEMQKFLNDSSKEITKAIATYYRIRLRLNPKEHKALIDALETALSVLSGKVPYRDREAISKTVEAVANESQAVLKKEWRRVKRGETPFFITKYVSLALLVASAILLAVYLTGRLSITWVV